MISVDDAIATILDATFSLEAETVSIADCVGRITVSNIMARLTQPPFAASAMDGYAVRIEDAGEGAVLKVIGEAPAGSPFHGLIGKGEAVRIFTGGVVPNGADHIVIQEDVARADDEIIINEPQKNARNIRKAGIDFREGDVLVKSGTQLHEVHGSILAAANILEISVKRRPRIAIFSNGDELVEPGSSLKPGEIVNSNHYALCAMAKSWGGVATYLGCAADNEAAIRAHFERARADVIVPVGGASVGDYDYVKTAFSSLGGEVFFEKIAVRPGKPTWFGKLGNALVLGLPGNPASAIVTAALFLQPLVRRFAGVEGVAETTNARLTNELPANGQRETYMRAIAKKGSHGGYEVTPVTNQDSSLLSPFSNANTLIRRPVSAPALKAGDVVEVVSLR